MFAFYLPQAVMLKSYSLKFYKAFANFDCRPSHLSLFNLPTADLESFLLEKNIIYVGGGNTKSMLALWYAWGLDDILRKAWENDVLLAGISAGAICWFEQGMTELYPRPIGAFRLFGVSTRELLPPLRWRGRETPGISPAIDGGQAFCRFWD